MTNSNDQKFGFQTFIQLLDAPIMNYESVHIIPFLLQPTTDTIVCRYYRHKLEPTFSCSNYISELREREIIYIQDLQEIVSKCGKD